MAAVTNLSMGEKIGLGVAYSILFGLLGGVIVGVIAFNFYPKYLGKAALAGALIGITYAIYKTSTAKIVGGELQ